MNDDQEKLYSEIVARRVSGWAHTYSSTAIMWFHKPPMPASDYIEVMEKLNAEGSIKIRKFIYNGGEAYYLSEENIADMKEGKTIEVDGMFELEPSDFDWDEICMDFDFNLSPLEREHSETLESINRYEKAKTVLKLLKKERDKKVRNTAKGDIIEGWFPDLKVR